MENSHDVLARLEKHSRRQLTLTTVLCLLCAVVVICTLVLTVSITGAAKQLVALAEPLQEVATQVQDMSAQAETVMNNLDTVTQELADADLGSMVDTMNILAADSQSVVTEAMKKLETIDIDTLNKAIEDLAKIVEPLAKVSKIFG